MGDGVAIAALVAVACTSVLFRLPELGRGAAETDGAAEAASEFRSTQRAREARAFTSLELGPLGVTLEAAMESRLAVAVTVSGAASAGGAPVP